jgi:hypothetical protein
MEVKFLNLTLVMVSVTIYTHRPNGRLAVWRGRVVFPHDREIRERGNKSERMLSRINILVFIELGNVK